MRRRGEGGIGRRAVAVPPLEAEIAGRLVGQQRCAGARAAATVVTAGSGA